jgi:hypothetical protein
MVRRKFAVAAVLSAALLAVWAVGPATGRVAIV